MVKSVKLMHFLKNLLLYSGAWFRKTKYIVMMTKEGSTKIVKIMTPRAGFLMLGLGHISHYSDNVVSSTLLIYITLVAIMMLLSYTIIDFHLFNDGTVDIQI